LLPNRVSYLEAMSQVCDDHLLQGLNLSSIPTDGKDFAEILKKIAVDSVLFCKFRGEIAGCDDLLEEIITDDGVCSTFNMIPLPEMFSKDVSVNFSWSSRFGYESESYKVYPHRAFTGSDIGFNIVLNQKSSDLDFMCRGPVQGWKVKIHSPDELPRMATGFQRIPLNSETSIVVKPEVTVKAGEAGSTCHSTTSKPLKVFKEYSQVNCITECLSSFVFSQCGCVKFSMVHDNETEVCNQQETKCVSEAIKNFSTVIKFKDQFSCDCKPSCNSLKYNTKVYQADFEFKRVFTAYKEDLEEEFPSSLMSRLVVYLEDDFYVPTADSTINNTPIDIIARIGGILAFFLGASWISFIEVFYYFARRFVF
jgi:acid-sensing ion channel, other